MFLVNCLYCQHEISETALICPACGKPTVEERENCSGSKAKNTAKWIGAAAITVALGPAALLGGAASLAVGLGQNRKLRNTAKKVRAIDFFALSNEWNILVTKTGFIWYYDSPYDEVPWSSIRKVFIDDSKSRNSGLFSSYREVIIITRVHPHKPRKIITEKYKLTGENAKELAQIALGKFSEYSSIKEPEFIKKNVKASVEKPNAKDSYEKAWEELEEGKFDKAIYAKAFADTEGDSEKTKALYIKMRVKQLKKEYNITP